MGLFILFAVFLRMTTCQSISFCPANPISGVPPLPGLDDIAVCLCPGLTNESEYCSNGGSCSGGLCTLQICPTTNQTSNLCHCAISYIENESCRPGYTCTVSGCVAPECTALGTVLTSTCNCGTAGSCYEDEMCSHNPDACSYPECTALGTVLTSTCNCGTAGSCYEDEICSNNPDACSYPECMALGTVLTSTCNCGTVGSCLEGEICTQSPDDCNYPACPTSDKPVTDNCKCGTGQRCSNDYDEICVPGANGGLGFCGPVCPVTQTEYECKCGTVSCDVDQTCSAGSCTYSICGGDGNSEAHRCECGTGSTCNAGEVCTSAGVGSCVTPVCAGDELAEPYYCSCGTGEFCMVGQACIPSGAGSCTTPNCVNGVKSIGICICNTNENCYSGEVPTACDFTGTAGSCVWLFSCNPYQNHRTCSCGSYPPYTICTDGQDCNHSTKTCSGSLPSCLPSYVTASCWCSSVTCAAGETCSVDGTCTAGVLIGCLVGIPAPDSCQCSSSVTCALGDTCSANGTCIVAGIDCVVGIPAQDSCQCSSVTCALGETCYANGTCTTGGLSECVVGIPAQDSCQCSSVTCALGETCYANGTCTTGGLSECVVGIAASNLCLCSSVVTCAAGETCVANSTCTAAAGDGDRDGDRADWYVQQQLFVPIELAMLLVVMFL